ncbi:FAD-dependent pyridine nucleotide-disulfide oxidoreductase [Penicillium riverlandense]|uniref:FAD-dependent pyridine nucleotide-disulfide oxidoreductase n=1 Tax=Penicillium riverlandense TaxID=1903569 RepID=UPI002546B570|nr:FAD-dependent pyridine nucleotide-disulfide oxidoreductase [Penicillium riverlandense]KAJ5832134.1 FAD-dependent pyridine nucleotide-disulfide oxidoreductase [Penicillium riverlandense]
MAPKKVAIIGAGPSGLVTAKTLLHSFPPETFAPTVFDSRDQIGGLWPVTWDDHVSARRLDPWMHTNLSRFTVAFSDLAWESVFPDAEIPLFPCAKKVGTYLAKYRERYVPQSLLRLGHKVVRTTRRVEKGATRWTVYWVIDSAGPNGEVASEDFDLLVVASGHFARPCIPDIPGLDQFPDRAVHSSVLRFDKNGFLLCNNSDTAHGNVIVIGGSMSGVEAASAVALQQSSTAHSTETKPQSSSETAVVHHIYSHPFWTLPTYLPHETGDDTISFLPLDLVMYDLSRRSNGPVEYAVGPIPAEKAQKTNKYFHSLLGPDYERFGHAHQPYNGDEADTRAPWVAIGNDYAEYVRSQAIERTMGRAVSVQHGSQDGLASITVKVHGGQIKTIDRVTAIVLATGYTPFDSLSFLPDDVLSALEYSAEDSHSPLILDKGGTVRSEMPDFGFVGFYRGPYWGVMEMQARLLGQIWSTDNDLAHFSKTEDQRESLRALRLADPGLRRGQFPMGDYVGLMESFARDLGIRRAELSESEGRPGPVAPARYVYPPVSSTNPSKDQATMNVEAKTSLNFLKSTLASSESTATEVIFRALHGTWQVHRTHTWSHNGGTENVHGSVTLHPRYLFNPALDKEYVCHEFEQSVSAHGRSFSLRNSWIFRAPETDGSGIKVLTETKMNRQTEQRFNHYIQPTTPFYRKKHDADYIPGQYVIYAKGVFEQADSGSPRALPSECKYTFHFHGVSISSWVLEWTGLGDESQSVGHQVSQSRTVYER